MDPIANMISAINNAISSKKQSLTVPFSNMKLSILEKLKFEKYIENYSTIKVNDRRMIKINLCYINGKNRISHLKRISSPSLRRYVNYKYIPKILNGMGEVIVSTSAGVITGKEARKKNIGGELICEVY